MNRFFINKSYPKTPYFLEKYRNFQWCYFPFVITFICVDHKSVVSLIIVSAQIKFTGATKIESRINIYIVNSRKRLPIQLYETPFLSCLGFNSLISREQVKAHMYTSIHT